MTISIWLSTGRPRYVRYDVDVVRQSCEGRSTTRAARRIGETTKVIYEPRWVCAHGEGEGIKSDKALYIVSRGWVTKRTSSVLRRE